MQKIKTNRFDLVSFCAYTALVLSLFNFLTSGKLGFINKTTSSSNKNTNLLGLTATVQVPGLEVVLLAAEPGNASRIIKTQMARDIEGVQEFIPQKWTAAGRIFAVPKGTQVRVIDEGSQPLTESRLVELRVLSGEHQGQTGWTDESFLNK